MKVAEISLGPTGHSRDTVRKAKGDHLGRIHSDQKVLEVIRWGEAGLCYPRLRISKLAQGTIRLESTQIRWFS
jgi:hypothetical protein